MKGGDERGGEREGERGRGYVGGRREDLKIL